MSDKEQRGLLEAKKYGGLAQEIAALLSQPKPAPVLLTDEEMERIFRRPGGWLERYREIEAAVLKKHGIET